MAIADAQNAAERAGLVNTHYQVMNAEDMTFDSASFDVVFGRGIIHHRDLELAFRNIARVLRPGGVAIFWEPLGHNPILNRYRDMTPQARTPDEHPLLRQDFELAGRYFDLGNLQFWGLTTILSVPMWDTAVGEAVLSATAKLDQMIFKTPARWMAWHVLMDMKKLH